MKKRYYRFFGGLVETQEKWLNKMAEKGYRLVKTGKFSYQFEDSSPGEYEYRVQFVGEKSYTAEKDYRAFLEELGYTVFYKNINLNYSIGKVKWRPYGKGFGQIATNPGNYNKELLIIEKKRDSLPFSLHTSYADLAAYYQTIRNAYLTIVVMLTAMAIWQATEKGLSSIEAIVFAGLGILFLLPTLFYQKRVSQNKQRAKIEE